MRQKTLDLINSKPKYNLLQLNGRYNIRENKLGRTTFVECICDCGCVSYYDFSNLKSGNTTKCFNHNVNMCIGNTFGELTVLERHYPKQHPLIVICECSCGDINDYALSHLTSGETKRCYFHHTNNFIDIDNNAKYNTKIIEYERLPINELRSETPKLETLMYYYMGIEFYRSKLK